MAPRDGIGAVYSSTFTLFRLSPLYVPDTAAFWTTSNLNSHAKRFADSIQTENLRGFNTVVEEADDTINKAGPFRQCVWSELKQSSDDEEEQRSADDLGLLEGLRIDVEYEKAKYTALLLRGVDSGIEDDQTIVKLPLIFIRMPVPLRSSFTHYLATEFDTRMELLQLSSATICMSLENFLQECIEDEDSFEKTVKEIQLTLSFQKPVAPNLKAIDIAFKKDDVLGFLRQGQAINATSVTNVKSIEGVFIAALHQYLLTHIALDVNAEQVIISKVACGAFALGREGKVKLFAPGSKTDENGDFDAASMASRRAMAQILQILLQTAAGNT